MELFICMGSACHQAGVYEFLPVLQKLLVEYDLEDTVVLKGAFCLGPCTEGIVLKFGSRVFMNLNVNNLERRFREQILPCLT